MKKLLLCIGALATLHLQVAANSAMSPQVATDKLFELVKLATETKPVGLDQVKELLAAGADLNVVKDTGFFPQQATIPLQALTTISDSQFYELIFAQPNFNPNFIMPGYSYSPSKTVNWTLLQWVEFFIGQNEDSINNWSRRYSGEPVHFLERAKLLKKIQQMLEEVTAKYNAQQVKR